MNQCQNPKFFKVVWFTILPSDLQPEGMSTIVQVFGQMSHYEYGLKHAN